MRSLIITLLVILAFACAIFAQTDDPYPSYDLAPGVIPGSGSSAQTDEMWDLQYFYGELESQTGDNGLLGIAFDGDTLWVSGRGAGTNPNMIYLFDPNTGNLLDQFPSGTSSSWGVRDMCSDGTYMYGGWEEGLVEWDNDTHEIISTIPFPTGMSFPRANAYNPATDHFYCGGATCYEQDREGNLIRSWSPSPLSAIYGMAWDDDDPEGPWLWVHDQSNPSSGCNVWQFDPSTLTYTGVNVSLQPPIGTGIAGGLDYCQGIVPQYASMLSLSQGTPDMGAAWEMYTCPSYAYVELTPASTPIIIPSNGGSFDFNIEVSCFGMFPLTFDVWTMATLPQGGEVGPLLGPHELTIAPPDSINRDRIQDVPANAPGGNYTYDAYVGNYPDDVWDEAHFDFEKLTMSDGGAVVPDWNNWGESFYDVSAETVLETPDIFTLYNAYPNPFNPTTVLSFDLRAASLVKLTVYDVIGREVVKLVDGWVDAGSHKAVFNGSGLSSGVYFARFQTSDFRQARKLLLVK